MDKRVFIFWNSSYRDRCKVFLDTIPLGPECKPVKVTVEDYKKNRSAAQQALMWIWHGQWSKQFGDLVPDEHIRFKAVHLLPLLLRERLVLGLDYLYSQAKAKELEGNREPIMALYRIISTSGLSVSHFAEILTAYQHEAASRDCFFTVRAPEYYEAFNIKEK